MRLFAAGSNSDGQLGIGHADDVAVLTPCIGGGDAFPPKGWLVHEVASTATATAVLCRHSARTAACELWIAGAWAGGAHSTSFVRVDVCALARAAGVEARAIQCIGAAWDAVYVAVQTPSGDQIVAVGTSNAFGQLGARAAAPMSHVHRVHVESALRDVAWRARDAPANGTLRIQSLVGGVRHVLASVDVLCDGAVVGHGVVGWGHARHGQLGLVRGSDGPGRRGVQWTPAMLFLWGAAESTLAAGMQHSVVRVQCAGQRGAVLLGLGSHRQGQLDWSVLRAAGAEILLPQDPPPVPAIGVLDVVPACNWHSTQYLCAGSTVVAAGASQHGQTAAPPHAGAVPETSSHEAALRAGSEHTLWLSASGHVYGWGWNEHGNLGHNPESVHAAVLLCDGARGAWAGKGTSFVAV